MKTIIIAFLSLGGAFLISSCTTVEQREPATHISTSTTEETTVSRPFSSSVETQTTPELLANLCPGAPAVTAAGTLKLNHYTLMSKQTRAISNDLGQLAEDARALMIATADVAGDKVEAARKRLAAALDGGKDVYERVKDGAIESARVANEALHEHPYKAIATGIGLGALFGYLVARRCRCS